MAERHVTPTHYVAECDAPGCNWFREDYRVTVVQSALRHHRRTGHIVYVHTSRTIWYEAADTVREQEGAADV